MLTPFLAIGWDATLGYVDLVRGRGHGDVHDDGFAEALLSWSGFLRAATGSAQPDAWLALSLVTAAAFALVWRKGQPDLLPSAAVLATLLIGPHSHPQDWLMLAPAGCFLLRNQSGYRLWTTTALLLSLLLGLRSWLGLADTDRAIYWPTASGAACLLWVTALSFDLDRRLVASITSRLSRSWSAVRPL
jgi:hypothetical protein